MAPIAMDGKAMLLNGLRVLVVDANADSRDLLEFVLEQSGAKVMTADCCTRAIALVQQLGVDLLLSELQLPKEDGYALIRQIRALETQQAEQVQAIAVSGYASQKDCDRAILAGYQKHFAKPIDVDELVSFVSSLNQPNS